MKFNNPLPIILIVGGIALLQIHAIEFWIEHTGKTGVLWSLIIEMSALWLWSKRGWPTLLAIVASTLALAGPLYQVATPVINELQSNTQSTVNNQQSKALLTEEIASLEASLVTYNNNSEKRLGWAELIAETQNRLFQARAELKQATTATSPPLAWQAWAVVLLQAIALLLVQLVVVMAIRTVTPIKQTIKKHKKPKAPVFQKLFAAPQGQPAAA